MANQWDVELYEARHSFVWEMAASLLNGLDPKPGETIVDLGCGTAQLTAEIASRGARTIGIDSSPAMVAQARANYPHMEFRLADATSFVLQSPVDAVFSNAALHWVKEAEAAVACIAAALRPGGRFVAEFGGYGNVRVIQQALAQVVGEQQSPWYFPSVPEYGAILQKHGLELSKGELFDRWTPLEGEDGLVNWLEMFAEPFLAGQPAANRPKLRKEVAEAARPALYRDGKWHADYRRIRIYAVKMVGPTELESVTSTVSR